MATTRVMLSEEEIVKIIDYYVNNKTSFKKVASLFNTKEYLVREMLRDRGLTKCYQDRKIISTDIRNEIIRIYLEENKSATEISKILDIKIHIVNQVLRQSGTNKVNTKAWNKGKTKNDNESIRKYADSIRHDVIKTADGYSTVYIKELDKRKRMHDAVWYENTGYWPDRSKNEQIHHIDGDKENNNINNLILCTWDVHSAIHKRYEDVAYILIKEGIITFNKESNSLCLEKLFEMVKKFNQ